MRPAGPDGAGALSRRRAEPLEALSIDGLSEEALPFFEAALQQVCGTVAYFRDEPSDTWRVEGVREAGAGQAELESALALAAMPKCWSGLTWWDLQRTHQNWRRLIAIFAVKFLAPPVNLQMKFATGHFHHKIRHFTSQILLNAK